MDHDQMPRLSSKDIARLSTSDFLYIKRTEEENLRRVAQLKKIRNWNLATGIILGLGVCGIYGYTIAAVKQEKFLDDFDEPEKIVDAK